MSDYAWYKSYGICPRCRQNDAAKGRIYCLDCLGKEAVATMHYRITHDTKKKNRVYCQMRYQAAKDQGICAKCFQRPARPGKAICQFCFNKTREKQAIYQRLKRAERKRNGDVE